MPANELLEGAVGIGEGAGDITESDVEDIASDIADRVQAVYAVEGEFPMPLRWAIEGAVKEAFGVEDADD